MTTAQLTTQRRDHLACANTVRTERARHKRDLRILGPTSAPQHLAALLADPPPELHGVPIGEALGWLPRWGVGRVDQVLADHAVRWSAAIAGVYGPGGVLTDRQRHTLADALNPGRRREASRPRDTW